MKRKANKKALVRVLSTSNLSNNVTMVGREESVYSHDEADITIISYLLEAVTNGKNVVRVIINETDVFVLLIFWVWRLQMTARVQLDRWCGAILNINESSSLVGAKFLQLLGMHALSGCDTVSYPLGHGKATALKVLKSADQSGLYTVFGEQSANHQQLLETGRKIICSLYGVAAGENMVSARYALYIKRTRGKAVCVCILPPTDANLSYHILRAHHQVMLWKAADQQTPPAVNIAAYGWSVVQGVCHLHALQEDQQLLLPSWSSSTANAKLSGKLAAVMHVAVILQDCLARYTVIVLAKPCATILSPNMTRKKLNMKIRMKVIVRRKRGARENGE